MYSTKQIQITFKFLREYREELMRYSIEATSYYIQVGQINTNNIENM